MTTTKKQKLTVRGEAIALFMSAVKKSENLSDALLYIEEDLIDDEIQSFIILIGYCRKNAIMIGRDNINSVMADAHEGLTLELEDEYVEIHRKTIRDSNMDVQKRYDQFESELKEGDYINLMKGISPLKGSTVVSYNSETKTLILKLK